MGAARPKKPSPPSVDHVLEDVFKVVIEKAREDPAFAERLIAALGRELALAKPKRVRRPAPIPPALAELDLAAMILQDGRRKAQRFLELGPFTIAQLRAFAEARAVPIRGATRRRIDLISAILSAHSPARAAAFTPARGRETAER